MTAHTFLKRAKEQGLSLLPDGDCLKVRGPLEVRQKPSVIAFIKGHKAELLTLLTAAQENQTSCPYTAEELAPLGTTPQEWSMWSQEARAEWGSVKP